MHIKKLLGSQTHLLTLGGVTVSKELEALHTLIIGSTGTGKTTLQDEVLSTLIPRGDRMIIVDPNGHSISHWFNEKIDTILNPFDARSPGWCIFNDIRSDYDCDQLARSVIPDGSGSDRSWHHYAQILMSETLRALLKRGETTTYSLMHWLTVASAEELSQLLTGTPAQVLFDEGASRALSSTRFVISTHLNPHKYLQEGSFSLRDWLLNSAGNLFISWRDDMQTALKALVSTWCDILCNAVLSLPENPNRRIWLILDELAALEPLSSLESALTRGRKNGLCVFSCLQSTAQLEKLYSREGATVLQSCYRNLVVLGIAKTDPTTAEALSKSLGEREVEREQISRSEGPQGVSKSTTLQRIKERLVMPSEITELENLCGFVALAGNNPAIKVKIKRHSLPIVAKAMEER